MLLPFVKEENILNQKPFICDEVHFNVIHKIYDDPKALLLRTEGNNVIIARSSSKFPMWIWVNPNTDSQVLHDTVTEVKRIVREESFDVDIIVEFCVGFFIGDLGMR